jgi:hypothetical protein
MSDKSKSMTKPFIFPADRLVRINAARETALAAGVAAARAAGRDPRSYASTYARKFWPPVPDASAEEIAASLIWNAERTKQEAKERRHQRQR